MANQPHNQRKLVTTRVIVILRNLRKLTLAKKIEYAGVLTRSTSNGHLIERVVSGFLPDAEMRSHGILGAADIHQAVAAIPHGFELLALFHTHPGAQPSDTIGTYDPFSPADHYNTRLYGVPHYVVEGDGRVFVDLLDPFGGGTRVFWEGNVSGTGLF